MLSWRLVILFILLVLIQVTILNQVTISGYINPQVYLLFILILPLNIPGWLLLFYAFVMGMAVDMFSDSLAIHTASTLFMAFCRPGIIRLVSGSFEKDPGAQPSYKTMGGISLALYSVILILLHHVLLFFLEIFHFSEAAQTLSRIFFSSMFSFAFVMIGFAILEKASPSHLR